MLSMTEACLLSLCSLWSPPKEKHEYPGLGLGKELHSLTPSAGSLATGDSFLFSVWLAGLILGFESLSKGVLSRGTYKSFAMTPTEF